MIQSPSVGRPFVGLGLIAGLILTSSLTSHSQTMTWNTVRVGGGGAVTSVQAHPKIQNLFFMTTDVGTPYRWNNAAQKWEGLFYKTAPANWENRNAAARLAFAPSDVSGAILYATTGGPWAVDGTVLKSTNRGDTWTACPIVIDVKPNKEQSVGQRIAVDPLNSNVVYVTTKSSAAVAATNGTFKTTNAGSSWAKVNDLYGSFVEFDASAGAIGGVTKNIYIGCSNGVHRSTDGGATFQLMVGSPTGATKSAIHSSGVLYVTHSTGIAKWNGISWANVSPATTGTYAYTGIAVNPQNVNHLVANFTDWTGYRFFHYRSNNGGTAWTQIPSSHDKTEVPWFATTIGQATVQFCWDPFNQNSVWFTDFFFGNQTANIWAGPPVSWKSRSVGHEETVSIGTLLCPPSGSNLLLSSVADVGGWDHKSLTSPPTVGMQTHFPWASAQPVSGWGNMTGVAVQETNPNFIARVGRYSWDGGGYAGYSLNGGTSYTKWTSPSNAAGGRIAVAANSETIVWLTQLGPVYRSTNRGVTWTAISTLPSNILLGGNVFASGPRYPLAADKVNGNKFYIYHYQRVYVSVDAGATFAAAATLPDSYPTNHLTLETTPGKEGDLWVGMIEQGLYHSTNSGSSFSKLTNVQSAKFFAIGKASSSNPTVPAIYVFGTVNSVANHLFRSDNNGVSWTDLGIPEIGTLPMSMAADRNVYGRVYFGTAGNGTFVGDITSEVIVDNTSAGVTTSGTWTSSSFTAGFYGIDYVHDGNAFKGSMALRWTPTLSSSGNYTVYARWTSDTNRATNVPFEIVHAGGTANATVNMQTNGGAWVSLGTYAFNAGTTGSVRVSNAGTNGHVIADAVRFVKQ